MTSRTIVLSLCGLIAGGLLALMMAHGPGRNVPASGEEVSGTALIGGPFRLTDQSGKSVTEKDFLGRYMLVFFGFTHCPDICPSSLQVMSAALDALGDKANDIQPIFITLDAARDTPDKLAAYLKSFHPRLVGLTGSTEDLTAAAKTYRVYAQKVAGENNPNEYTYDHSTIFYLMGRDGVFIAPIPHTTDPKQMASDITKAMN